MKPKTLKAWSAVHTWTSLVCTAFLLLLCVTGLGMIWIHEIDARYAGHPAPPPVPVSAPGSLANLDAVFRDAEARTPGERVTYADWAFDGEQLGVNMAPPGKAKNRRQLVYQAQTGRYLEDSHKDNPNQPVRVFLGTINKLHITMWAGLPGEFFLAAMTVLFVIAT
ncbi:MAG: PepSY domain-containing protein, partial [Caulobacteraceae bacterium]